MASASTPSANEPVSDLILIHTIELKPVIKTQISRRMIPSGMSDVAITSVHSEKTRLKKLMKIIIINIMNKSQEMTVFCGLLKLTSATKLRMVDFKFDALYR